MLKAINRFNKIVVMYMIWFLNFYVFIHFRDYSLLHKISIKKKDYKRYTPQVEEVFYRTYVVKVN